MVILRNRFVSGKGDRIFFALIIGGAFGNLIDRIFRGYVIDFLDLEFWTVFNLADLSITVGAMYFFAKWVLKR